MDEAVVAISVPGLNKVTADSDEISNSHDACVAIALKFIAFSRVQNSSITAQFTISFGYSFENLPQL
jgi:hypothetical protein